MSGLLIHIWVHVRRRAFYPEMDDDDDDKKSSKSVVLVATIVCAAVVVVAAAVTIYFFRFTSNSALAQADEKDTKEEPKLWTEETKASNA